MGLDFRERNVGLRPIATSAIASPIMRPYTGRTP
jgi:hypothetical protein